MTLRGVNTCFIHHLSNVKNYSIGHKLKTDQPKKVVLSYIFYIFLQNFGSKFKIPIVTEIQELFQHLGN